MYDEWEKEGEKTGLMVIKQTEYYVDAGKHLKIYEEHPNVRPPVPSLYLCRTKLRLETVQDRALYLRGPCRLLHVINHDTPNLFPPSCPPPRWPSHDPSTSLLLSH